MPPLPQQTALPIPRNTAGGPPQAPLATATPSVSPLVGRDPVQGILDPIQVDNEIKAQTWDAYHSTKTPEEFQKHFDALGIPQESKAALWDLKFKPPVGDLKGAQREIQRTSQIPLQMPQGVPGFQTEMGPLNMGGLNPLAREFGLGFSSGITGMPESQHPFQAAKEGMQQEAAQSPMEGLKDPSIYLGPGYNVAKGFYGAGKEMLAPQSPDPQEAWQQRFHGLGSGVGQAMQFVGPEHLLRERGGVEAGVRPGPRDIGQPSATQNAPPPSSGAAEAITKMHKEAFGVEGGPRPVTEAGQTGAREVTGGVGRGEPAVPLTQPPAGRGGTGTERRTGPQVQLPKDVERRQLLARSAAESAALAAKQTPAYDAMRARERGSGGRLAPEAIEADRQARAAEVPKRPKGVSEVIEEKLPISKMEESLRGVLEDAKRRGVDVPQYKPNMRAEPAGLGDLAKRQRVEGRITDQAKDRLVGEQARLKAGLKPEDAPVKFPGTVGEQGKTGFRWSALSPKEQQKFMEVASREKAKPTATSIPTPAPEAPTTPGSAGKLPTPTEPVREPAGVAKPKAPPTPEQYTAGLKREYAAGGPQPGWEKSKQFAEAPKTPSSEVGKPVEPRLAPTTSPKPIGTDFDKLKQRVLRVGGDQKAVDAIIRAADLKGGTAKERTERAMEGLRNYGSQMWKEQRAKGKKGEAGFFSFRGRPVRAPSVAAAYKSSMGKLDGVVESTSSMDVDKAAQAARDKVKETFGLKDKMANAFMEMRASGKAFAHWYMHPEEGRKLSESGALPEGVGGPPATPSRGFKETFGTYSEGRQQSKYATGQFIDHIKRETTPMGRHGITNYLQAGGDIDVLRQRAEATSDPKLKKGYEVAQQLSPKEKRIAEAIKNYFDDRLKEAMDLGVLDHGLENYVTQIWDKDTPFRRGILSDINAGKFQKSFRYAKERFHGSYFEGEQVGKNPTNKDIGFLVSAYENSLNEAIMARKFVKDMWQKAATDGRPLVVPEGKLARPIKDPSDTLKGRAIPMRGPARGKLMSTELAEAMGIPLDSKSLTEADKARTDTSDYVRIDHPAFRTWQFSTEGPDGKPIFAEADARVHPDIAKRLENMYTNSWFQQRWLGRAVLKGQGFLKQTLLGVPGFHYVQEGFHATAHGVNPLSGDIISGRSLKSAMADPVIQDGMRKGLMLYDHNASQKFGEGIRGVFGLIPGLGKEMTIGNKVVGGYMEGMQEHLFQTYIPGLKAEMFKKALGRNLRRYAGDIQAGKVNKAQLTEITAAQANAAFGELNYDWMGRNRTAQDIFRLAALAPDFLEARLRFAGQALRPYGAEQRMALFIRLGAMQYAMARIANMTTNDGDPLWDPEYMFQWKIGDRVYGLRSMMSDMQHLYKDPSGFAFYRMSPLMRQGIAQPAAQYFGGRKMTLEDVVKENAPIPLQGLIQDYFNKGMKDKQSANSFLQSLGVQSKKYRSPGERERLEQLQEKRQKMLRGEKTGLGKPRAPR